MQHLKQLVALTVHDQNKKQWLTRKMAYTELQLFLAMGFCTHKWGSDEEGNTFVKKSGAILDAFI